MGMGCLVCLGSGNRRTVTYQYFQAPGVWNRRPVPTGMATGTPRELKGFTLHMRTPRSSTCAGQRCSHGWRTGGLGRSWSRSLSCLPARSLSCGSSPAELRRPLWTCASSTSRRAGWHSSISLFRRVLRFTLEPCNFKDPPQALEPPA